MQLKNAGVVLGPEIRLTLVETGNFLEVYQNVYISELELCVIKGDISGNI